MSRGEVRFRRRFGKFSPWKIADLDRNQQRDGTGFKRGERVGGMGRRDVPQSTRHPSLEQWCPESYTRNFTQSLELSTHIITRGAPTDNGTPCT